MNEPIHEDNLTMLHARYSVPLLLLQNRAIDAKFAIDTADGEASLNTALGDVTRITALARTVLTGSGLEKPDMPFGEVGLETRLHDTERTISSEDVSTDDSDDDESISTSMYSASSDGDDDYDHSDEESKDMMDFDSSSSDGEEESQDTMDLEKSAARFIDLRRVNSLHCDIHLHRLRRLVLRLPPPLPSEASVPRLDDEALSMLQNMSLSPSPSGAGVPLSQDKATEYAEVIVEELALTAEYRRTMLEVLMRGVAGYT